MSQVSRGVCSGSFTRNPTYGFTYEYIIKITFKVPRQEFNYIFYINYLKVAKIIFSNAFEEKKKMLI